MRRMARHIYRSLSKKDRDGPSKLIYIKFVMEYHIVVYTTRYDLAGQQCLAAPSQCLCGFNHISGLGQKNELPSPVV